jgi:GNAT superfamily N-acetyltransferase
MPDIRRCDDDDFATILRIVNAAAEAYRGVIPADRWHEPYMSDAQLRSDLSAGVAFWGFEADGELIAVMGLQPVRDVDLIRHAYVLPGRQRCGVGAALITHLRRQNTRPMLVGTWAAAHWAIGFYRRHGFVQVSASDKADLLKRYWTIPERQIDTSVVLANPPYIHAAA